MIKLNSMYKLIDCVNRGSFGEVYVAESMERKELVALKVEKYDVKPSQIINEYKIYQLLAGKRGFALPHAFSTYQNSRILVLELLGSNLIELYGECGHRFSLKTVLMIVDQMIARLQEFHEIGFVHRDVKPQNIMIGRGDKKDILFLSDFGLSIHYSRSKKESTLPPLISAQITGTQLFSSVGSHLNHDQSPKDDLESLAYVIVYLLNGRLPWSGITMSDPVKKANIVTNTKMTSTVCEICGDAPEEFALFLRATKSLKDDSIPDYDGYRGLFRKLYQENQFPDDNVFDWTPMHKEVTFMSKKRNRRTI